MVKIGPISASLPDSLDRHAAITDKKDRQKKERPAPRRRPTASKGSLASEVAPAEETKPASSPELGQLLDTQKLLELRNQGVTQSRAPLPLKTAYPKK